MVEAAARAIIDAGYNPVTARAIFGIGLSAAHAAAEAEGVVLVKAPKPLVFLGENEEASTYARGFNDCRAATLAGKVML
jgi:hypothetical protein